MPNVYSTPKGVKIGLTYQRPAPQMTTDEELLQSALLKTKPVARWKNWISWVAVAAIIVVIFWSTP